MNCVGERAVRSVGAKKGLGLEMRGVAGRPRGGLDLLMPGRPALAELSSLYRHLGALVVRQGASAQRPCVEGDLPDGNDPFAGIARLRRGGFLQAVSGSDPIASACIGACSSSFVHGLSLTDSSSRGLQ